MGRWNRGQSGNPRGRPKNGIAVAELRTQVEKHRLIEKLGNIGARRGEYANVDMDKQVRAIQLLLSYGYGPPRGLEIGGTEGIVIQVVYAETNQITVTEASPAASASDSRSETVQRCMLRTPLGEDGLGNGPSDPSGSAG